MAQCRGDGGGGDQAVCGDLPGARPGPPAAAQCAAHTGCGACVAGGCAWCISQRACRVDEAWQCQGNVDHIGRSGIGKHLECPSQEAVDAERASRRARVAAEEQRRLVP